MNKIEMIKYLVQEYLKENDYLLSEEEAKTYTEEGRIKLFKTIDKRAELEKKLKHNWTKEGIEQMYKSYIENKENINTLMDKYAYLKINW